MNSIVRVFASRRMATVLFLGFSSGLPLALTGSTLQAWLTDAKVDLPTIGRFSLIGLIARARCHRVVSLPADPIERSARPERIMNQNSTTPGNAIAVVSR